MKRDKLHEKYLEERDYILANIEKLTKEDIILYSKKWNLPMSMPLFSEEKWIKGALHKGRLQVTKLRGISNQELEHLQKLSREALDELGWDYEIL